MSDGVETVPSCIFESLIVTIGESREILVPVTVSVPAIPTLPSKVAMPVTSNVPGISILEVHSTPVPAAFV